MRVSIHFAEFEKRWGEFPSSIQSIQDQSFKVFPNPAFDILEFRGLPEVEGVFYLKNGLGQLVLSEKRGPSMQSSLQVAGLPAGQYIITFVSAHVASSVPFQKI